jgi:hypothetical protein
MSVLTENEVVKRYYRMMERGIDQYNLPFSNSRGRVSLTEAGMGRLGLITGYLLGLCQGPQKEAAEKLLVELDSLLSYLGGYGGDLEFEYGGETRSAPAFKAVLGDDLWGIGSFTISWFRAIEPSKYAAMRAEYPEEMEYWQVEDAIQEKLNLNKELREWGGGVYVNYGYSFNGGLILHGADDIATASYGVHT